MTLSRYGRGLATVTAWIGMLQGGIALRRRKIGIRALESRLESDRERAERHERERKEKHQRYERERKEERERAARKRKEDHERHERERRQQ